MPELSDFLKHEKDRLFFADPAYQTVQCCLNGRFDIVEQTGALNPYSFENPKAVMRMLKWFTNINQGYALFTPADFDIDYKAYRAILDPDNDSYNGFQIERYGFVENPNEAIQTYTLSNFDTVVGYENMYINLGYALKYKQDLENISNLKEPYRNTGLTKARHDRCINYLERNLFENETEFNDFMAGWLESISVVYKRDSDIANVLGLVMSEGSGIENAMTARKVHERLKHEYALKGWKMDMDTHNIYPIIHPDEGGAACFGKVPRGGFTSLHSADAISNRAVNSYYWKEDPFGNWEENPNELPGFCNMCKVRRHCPHIYNQLMNESEEHITEKGIQTLATIDLLMDGFRTYLQGTKSVVLVG
jgi:hypothetical protein